MLREGRVVAEGFPAGLTRVRLLASVNPLVHSEGGAVPEGFVAHGARVRPLPSVHPPVLTKPYVVAEGLPTVHAIKGSLRGVEAPPVAD